jgi:hypothetical protein
MRKNSDFEQIRTKTGLLNERLVGNLQTLGLIFTIVAPLTFVSRRHFYIKQAWNTKCFSELAFDRRYLGLLPK